MSQTANPRDCLRPRRLPRRQDDPHQCAEAQCRRSDDPRQKRERCACQPGLLRTGGVAHEVKKVLQAAIANAENNHQLDVDRLVVSEASVGRALVMKRFHTRGRGKSARIEKPFSNLTVIVASAPKS